MAGIWFVEPLAAGNALRLHISPPAGTVSMRLLRNTTGAFSGPDDAGATLIWEGDGAAPTAVLDALGMVNGSTYHYRLFYGDGATWADASGIPLATYQEQGADALLVLMQRLSAGLAVEVARGVIQPPSGSVLVQNSPPLWDATPMPVVTVHLQAATQAERGIGELLAPDLSLVETWQEGEGFLLRNQITVIAWSMNPDERIALRRAISRILTANLPIFEELGLQVAEWSQRDQEDMQTYNAPIFQAVTEFSCLSALNVTGEIGKIEDVSLQVTAP